MIRLEDDKHCFACGSDNPEGLHLDFRASADSARAFFTASKAHQGYTDIVHGGIITAVLDEAMAKAGIELGIFAVTAEITVRFKEPLKVGEETVAEGRIVADKGRLLNAESLLRRLSDGRVVATATARLIKGEFKV